MGLSRAPDADTICDISGKARLTKGAAKSLAKAAAKRRDKGNITAYRCRACGGWHIGNVRKFA
jgi:hypothetical protein